MDNDKEIQKLVRVLIRLSRSGRFGAWRQEPKDAAEFGVRQFNRILARILEIEPRASTLFAPLAEDAALTVARMAAQDLATYFDESDQTAGEFHGLRFCGTRHGFVGAVHFGGKC